RQNIRHPQPASPGYAGIHSNITVLSMHPVARALCRQLPADCRFYVDSRAPRTMEIAADQLFFLDGHVHYVRYLLRPYHAEGTDRSDVWILDAWKLLLCLFTASRSC